MRETYTKSQIKSLKHIVTSNQANFTIIIPVLKRPVAFNVYI
jgi:hypothetical protein